MSSSAQDLSPQAPDLGNTFGAFFIGVILAALLFGVTNIQSVIYFQMNRCTGMSVYKLAVIWLWILDALHLSLIIHVVYYYLVTNYTNATVLIDIVWSYKLQFILNFLIIYVVHIMYAYRIWIISKGLGRARAIPVIVGIILIATSSVAFVAIWAVYQCDTFADLSAKDWTAYMTLGTIAINDAIITSSLCYLLVTSRTGFSSMNSFLTKLMAYIINTGCLTSVTSIATIITYVMMPHTLIPSAMQFIIIKLYVTSFLALMNARYYLQPKHSDLPPIPPPIVYIEESDVGGTPIPDECV